MNRSACAEPARFANCATAVSVRAVARLAHCSLTMAFESLLPSFAHHRLNANAEGFGSLMMGVGSGAFVASLFVSGLQTHRSRGQALVITGLLSGLGQVLLSFSTSLAPAIAGAAIMGGAQAAFMTMGQAVTQSIATNEFRGRVASINSFSLGGMMAVMNLLNGSLDDEATAPQLREIVAQQARTLEAMGRLVDALERRGELDDTVILWTSDHGSHLGLRGRQHGVRSLGDSHLSDPRKLHGACHGDGQRGPANLRRRERPGRGPGPAATAAGAGTPHRPPGCELRLQIGRAHV